MELRYAFRTDDESKAAKAMGRDLDISFKSAHMISRRLKGMLVSDAIKLLEDVKSFKRIIPFDRYKDGVGHRRGVRGHNVGRYPKKAADKILGVLHNLESNAEYKGFDTESLRIVHIEAQKGVARKRRKPKGRQRLWRRQFVSVQVVAFETESSEKETKTKAVKKKKSPAKKTASRGSN